MIINFVPGTTKLLKGRSY